MPMDVAPDALTAAAGTMVALAARVDAVGRKLEAATLSPPNVGDPPATAAFQQAHYDWTQTRFEDLTASAADLDRTGHALTVTAQQYRAQDTAAAIGLNDAAVRATDGGTRGA